MDLADLSQPIEVWKAVEGDTAELVKLLRSGKPIAKRTREALADWYDGKLRPFPIPRGRPPKHSPMGRELIETRYDGHDVTTPIGAAGHDYERLRQYIRKKGWHLKRAGRLYWSAERLLDAVARARGVKVAGLGEYLKRARPKSTKRSWYGPDYDAECRLRIALEIRRK